MTRSFRRSTAHAGLAFGVGSLILAGSTLAQEGTPAALTEERVRELVLETVRDNPQIVREAIEALQEQEAKNQIAAVRDTIRRNRATFERDPNAPVLGNPEGSATVVEFFDYNCPYCRKAADDVKALLAGDDDVRVVYREWPILGEGSLFAARAALAAREQGRYEDLHWALMKLRRAEEKTVLAAASELGLDIERLRRDMKAPKVEEHIAVSMQLAQALGINGTPSFVVGDELAPGLVPLERLQELVATARSDAVGKQPKQ